MTTDAAKGIDSRRLRRFALWVSLIALCGTSVVLFVAFIVDGFDVELASVLPWLYLSGSLILAGAAIVGLSLAPFGPDLRPRFVQRWATISRFLGRCGRRLWTHSEVVLTFLGVAGVVAGTLFFFDFTDGANASPSAWWILLVVAGVAVALFGIAGGQQEE